MNDAGGALAAPFPFGGMASPRALGRRERREQRSAQILGAAKVVTLAVWVALGVFLLRPTFLAGRAGYIMVSGDSMKGAFERGSLVITQKQSSYPIGTVIAYHIPKGEPGAGATVIHRIVGGSAAAGYVTRGDNRRFDDIWHPRPGDVIGAAKVYVPYVGDALGLVKGGIGLAMLGGGITLVLLWRRDDEPAADGAGPDPGQPFPAPGSDSTVDSLPTGPANSNSAAVAADSTVDSLATEPANPNSARLSGDSTVDSLPTDGWARVHGDDDPTLPDFPVINWRAV